MRTLAKRYRAPIQIAFFGLCLALFVVPLSAFGDAVKINPVIPGGQPTDDPAGIVSNFYRFALMIGGVLAFGAIVWGGIKYTVAAGNPSAQSEGKEWIRGALWGLLLLGGATLILMTINPAILTGALPDLEDISIGPVALGGLEGGIASGQLTSQGIGIKEGVSLQGIRQETVDEVIRLQGECGSDCKITITSATDSHAGGSPHALGYKVDLRPEDNLNTFIERNYRFIGNRSTDRAPQYQSPSGVIYAREDEHKEGDHWDVLVRGGGG